MAVDIEIDGVSTDEVRKPLKSVVSLENADNTGLTQLTWEIVAYPEVYDLTDEDASPTQPDFATNYAAWTLQGDLTLKIVDATPFAAVQFTADLPGRYIIRLTDNLGNQTTAVVYVQGPQDDQEAPAAGEETETGAFRGWARARNRNMEMRARRWGWFRGHNGTGANIGAGKVCHIDAAPDWRAVGGNAVPAGSATEKRLMPGLSIADGTVATASAYRHGIAVAAIPGGVGDHTEFGWIQSWGLYEADLTGYVAGQKVYVDASGDLTSTQTNVRIGYVIVAGASGVMWVDGLSPEATLIAGRVGYGSAGNLLTGEAAFAYDDATNTLSVDTIDLSNAGSAASPTIRFGDANTGVFGTGDNIKASTGGVERLHLSPAGALWLKNGSGAIGLASAGGFRYNESTNKIQYSENAGAWTDLTNLGTTATLTDTYIGYGDGSNQLTGTSELVFSVADHRVTLTAAKATTASPGIVGTNATATGRVINKAQVTGGAIVDIRAHGATYPTETLIGQDMTGGAALLMFPQANGSIVGNHGNFPMFLGVNNTAVIKINSTSAVDVALGAGTGQFTALTTGTSARAIFRADAEASTAYLDMRAHGSAFGGTGLGITTAGSVVLLAHPSANGFALGTDNAFKVVISTDNTSRVEVGSDGVVSISTGVTTSHLLDVVSAVTDHNQPTVRIRSSAGGQAVLHFMTSGTNLRGGIRADNVGNLSWFATGSGDHDFYTGGDFGSGTRRFKIDGAIGQLQYERQGDAVNPSIVWDDDPNTGPYHPGQDQLGWSTGGVSRATLDANGGWVYTQGVVTTGSPTFQKYDAAAHTTLTASTEAPDILYNLDRTVQFATGALTKQSAMIIKAPTYAFVASSTLTHGSTVEISGMPDEGTNATITNSQALYLSNVGPKGVTVSDPRAMTIGGDTAAAAWSRYGDVIWEAEHDTDGTKHRAGGIWAANDDYLGAFANSKLVVNAEEHISLSIGDPLVVNETEYAYVSSGYFVTQDRFQQNGSFAQNASVTSWNATLLAAALDINGGSGTLAEMDAHRVSTPSMIIPSGVTVTLACAFKIDGKPFKLSGTGTLTKAISFWVDEGIARFDGDGTHVFELPADATDPTSGGGAAAGRIPVEIGGATKYLAYY